MKPHHFLFSILAITWVNGFSQIPQIDVLHYRIELHVSDVSDEIQVQEEIEFKHIKTDQQIVFNLSCRDVSGKGMNITSLKMNGENTVFRHQDDSLYIESKKLKADTQKVKLSFEGIPKDGLIIGKNKYGSRTFFGDNWPTRAQNWFACNDHLSDKATVEYIIEAPKKYEAVANGALISVQKKRKSKIHHYRSSVALPTKIMVVGIAEMCIKEAGNVDGKTVRSCVYPKRKKEALYDLKLGPSILAFYSDYIAPYEYEKLDNVQSTTRFGGMENAGCIFYDENALNGTRSAEALIAHEIVHQWFGNSATEKDWYHLWLSEGFATYLTNIYIEQTKGQLAFQEQLKKDRNRIVSFEKHYRQPVVDSSYSSLMDLLNPNSYQKGGWVLHMLRGEIGDELFHKAIRTYYQKYRLSNADTKDFQDVVEQVSGTKLNWFFKQWLHKAGHPKLNIESEIHENHLDLIVNQVEGFFIFDLPIQVVFEDGGIAKEKLKVKDQQTRYSNTYNKSIQSIDIDPEVKLLFEFIE